VKKEKTSGAVVRGLQLGKFGIILAGGQCSIFAMNRPCWPHGANADPKM
jgi:hypothetical protein